MWEHAYYLDYLNEREPYVENVLKVVDWNKFDLKLLNDEKMTEEEEGLIEKLICPICKSTGRKLVMTFMEKVSEEESLFECDRCNSRRKIKNRL